MVDEAIIIVSLFVTGIGLAVIVGHWGAYLIDWLRDRL